ncbi:type VI secretion system baseplate subunit TssF [Massilia sp. W12]|uniref:type VI secretion system baseplate subunit TssF n=1 Tax=Massilia sp. W12 TaxID=3126507 RepID=UPI0030D53AB2
MQAANAKLKDHFREELKALRTEAIGFSEKHPELARDLGLNARQASDPQVEMLLQSFAFLTGRLRQQIEQDKAFVPNALLGFLYPHLSAPLPSMLIAQLGVKPDGPNFAKEQILERGRYVWANATNNLGLQIECRFRTCYETPLLPLLIDEIGMEAAAEYRILGSLSKAQSVLRVKLKADGVGQIQIQGKGPQRLRFYINDADPHAFALYEMLSLHLLAVTIAPAGGGAHPGLLPAANLHWLGMREDEAMLPANSSTHPGYRLLQEYFSFPEKFLFFEVVNLDQLNFNGHDNSFELLFVLSAPHDPNQQFTPHTLRMNCVPLINLFSQRIDPIALDHTEYEYHLMGDMKNHRYCEVYAIEELESVSSKGSPRPIVPYFAMEDVTRMEQQDYFYVARRELCQTKNIAGSEMFVSFLDQNLSLALPPDEVVGGRALCTNRRLPEQLLCGSPMHLEGAGPVTYISAFTKPTAHHCPLQNGQRPWALVSQLSLNHLSLASGAQAHRALKEILRLHIGSNPNQGNQQVDAILDIRARNIVRHQHRDAWRGFVRGLELTLLLDRSAFEHGSAVLFCSVLRHFFRLYASVNQIVELALETNDLKGTLKQWQPLAGATIVL